MILNIAGYCFAGYLVNIFLNVAIGYLQKH